MNIFKISEIVDMGIEKEKRRRDFYALAAKKFADKELITLFEKLRDWEETHIKKFSHLRDALITDEVTENYPGELTEYMQVVINEKIYQLTTPAEFEKKIKNVEDAIRVGIEFEKDAILFFNELFMYVVSAHKEVILQLIDEEKKHIVYLMQIRNKIKDNS